MKNFKLLLATTAILSTALTINAIASQITQDFNVGVKLITANKGLVKVQDLNFGNVLVDGDGAAGGSVTLAPDGTVSGTAFQYGGEQLAIVVTDEDADSEAEIRDYYDITVSGDEKIYDGTGESKKLCGHVSAWKHDTFHSNYNGAWNQGFHIGATFTLPSSAEWATSAAAAASEGDVSCTGEATATLIYTGTLTSGNSGSGE